MDKTDEKVSVAGDQSGFQQQQSSTLTNEDQSRGAAGHGGSKVEGGDQRAAHHGGSKVEGGDHTPMSTQAPFTEGYGITGGEEGEKPHGFANAV